MTWLSEAKNRRKSYVMQKLRQWRIMFQAMVVIAVTLFMTVSACRFNDISLGMKIVNILLFAIVFFAYRSVIRKARLAAARIPRVPRVTADTVPANEILLRTISCVHGDKDTPQITEATNAPNDFGEAINNNWTRDTNANECLPTREE